MTHPAPDLSYCVVTFMDVLGWKGIYARHSDPVGTLQRLVSRVERNCADWGRGLDAIETPIRVLSVSDTIIVIARTTVSGGAAAIDFTGRICSFALHEALTQGIPLRGAVAIGQASASESGTIVLGPAVDEAASWHESADWIGVHLAPSAFLALQELEARHWRTYDVPMKNGQRISTKAAIWKATNAEMSLGFQQLTPIVPAVSGKLYNTLDYLRNADRDAESIPPDDS